MSVKTGISKTKCLFLDLTGRLFHPKTMEAYGVETFLTTVLYDHIHLFFSLFLDE